MRAVTPLLLPFDGIGSYSTADMRPGTVAGADLDIAEAAGAWRGMTRADRNALRRLRAEHARIVRRHGENPYGSPAADEAAEALGYVAEEAQQLADAYLPFGLYAGAHPGDGADFGVWPVIGGDFGDDDRPRLADAADLDQQPADVREAYVVNDHGNVDAYQRTARGRWALVWSIV